jgi:hypothetical protein
MTRRRSAWFGFQVDDPQETGCSGFVFRIGRARFSFAWSYPDSVCDDEGCTRAVCHGGHVSPVSTGKEGSSGG